MGKAQNLNDIINYFDSQKALTLTEDYDWYVETNRKEIDIIKKKLRNTQYSRKFLFGGHPGNGKSTELNKIDSDKELNAKYLLVYNRMEENLIDKKALDMAIEVSGGVFRTLVDMITSASDYSCLYGGTKIDVHDMKTALDEERANKKRALDRVYYEILSEIYDHKQLLSTDKKESLELLHGLFALEYMNGEEWCDVHPLLVSEIEEYKKIKENEKS